MKAEELLARIQGFLAGCHEPGLLEPGEKIIPLQPGHFDLEIRGGAVVLQAWSAEASLARRLERVIRAEPGRLELAIRRLGKGDSSLALLDLARAGTHLEKQAARLEFRERFRRLLARELRDWEIKQISAAADLEHSLSPAYARALLARGPAAWAVIATEEDAPAAACDQILSFGLIWLDYLRQRETRRTVQGLKIFLPPKKSRVTANRLAFLDDALAAYELYEYPLARVDPRNYGNLATTLEPALPLSEPRPPVSAWVERLAERYGVERVPRADGLLSLRVRGLEFARASAQWMTYGLEEDRPVTDASLGAVEELAARLAAARQPGAANRLDPLYRAAPERWLESLARADIRSLAPSLRPHPLYCQVPAVAGADRGILDLLGVESSGRLAVLELKASQDPHLPLQGLDYWMRVKWHLERDEFRRRGYFRGIELRPDPPRLVLVSPLFEFHPTTETILRYFSTQVEVERVGLGMEWRQGLQVVFRARGAERPE
jgi:hypothetical protein